MTSRERDRLQEAVSAVLTQLESTGGPGGHCKAAARRHIVHDFAGESADFIYGLADGLARDDTGRWFAFCLARYHRPAFALLDDERIEALGRDIADRHEADAFARILAGPAWLAGKLSRERVHAWAARSGWWPRMSGWMVTKRLSLRISEPYTPSGPWLRFQPVLPGWALTMAGRGLSAPLGTYSMAQMRWPPRLLKLTS